MKKKIISLFLSVLMVLSVMPNYVAFADEASLTSETTCDHILTADDVAKLNNDFWKTHSRDDFAEGKPAFIGVVLPNGCETAGWTLAKTDSTGFCLKCGQFIEEEDKVYGEAKGHDFENGDIDSEATCTEAEVRECANWNYEIKVLNSNGVYYATIVETECEETASVGDPLGHDFGDFEATTDPECEVAGEETSYCSRCEATQTQPIDALGHAYGEYEETTPATCTEAGEETSTCANDPSHTQTRPIDALGHDLTFVEAVAPTCLDDGSKAYYECERCHEKFVDAEATTTISDNDIVDPALDHDIVTDKKVDPTCVAPGYIAQHCSRCDYERNENLNELGHDVQDWVVVIPNACEIDGMKEGKCSRCSKTIREVISGPEHNFVLEETQDATCTAVGYETYVCHNVNCEGTECGESYKTTLDPIGHNWGEWTEKTPATCTTDAVEERVCANDDTHVEERPGEEAFGHNYRSRVTTAPTCEEDGVRTFTCRRCGDQYTEAVPATGHNWGRWREYIAPTCTEAATDRRICRNDRSHIETRVGRDALGHDIQVSETYYPTCTEEGYNTYSCTRCEDIKTMEILEPLGHLVPPTGYEEYADCVHGNQYHCWRVLQDRNTGASLTTITLIPTFPFFSVVPVRCNEFYDDGERNYDLTFTWDSTIVTDEEGTPVKYNDDNVVVEAGITKPSAFEVPAEEIENFDVYVSTVSDPDEVYVDFVEGVNEETNKLYNGHDYDVEFVPARCEFDAYFKFTCYKGCPTQGEDEDGYTIFDDADEETAENEKFIVVIPNTATGHKWALRDDHSNVDAHCTTDGTRYWYCLNDHNHVYTEKLPATGHNWVFDSEVAATCGTDGTITYKCVNTAGDNDTDSAKGDICGETYTVVTNPATGAHKFSTVRTEATCTNDGFDTYTCDICGYVKEEATTPAKGHNYVVTNTVAATCTTEGYDVYTCNVCGDTYNKKTTPATGHEFVDGEFTAPTCTTVGYTTYVCTKGDYSFKGNYVNALGHNYTKHDVTEATCTAGGYTTHTCTNPGCTDSYVDSYTDKAAHVIASMDTVKATCTTDGSVTYACANCEYEFVEVLPAFGHNYGKVEVVEATCTAPGKTTYTCTNDGCTATYDTDATDIAEHVIKTMDTVKATCTTDGSVTYACANCDYKFVEVLPAFGHNYGKVDVVEATCTTPGKTTYTCTNNGCTATYDTDATDIADHVIAATAMKAATCTEDGYVTYNCANCEYSFVVTLPATGHNYGKVDVTDATCTEKGKTTFACTNNGCDASYVDDGEVIADHVITLTAVKAPTCSETGYKMYDCKNCDYSLVEVIPAVGHHYGNGRVVNATCVNKKFVENTCTVCGEIQKTEIDGDYAGHQEKTVCTKKATTSADGVLTTTCTVCGGTLKTTPIPAIKSVTLGYTETAYTGGAKKPGVKVIDRTGAVISNKNYTVTYSNNTAIGTATATITFKGNYAGTVNRTFKINPKGVGINSVITKDGAITVKYGKVANAHGYQIQYSTKSDFSSKKTVTVSSNSTTSKKITGLKKGTKYFIRIRAYKTVNGSKYYGKWTNLDKTCK